MSFVAVESKVKHLLRAWASEKAVTAFGMAEFSSAADLVERMKAGGLLDPAPWTEELGEAFTEALKKMPVEALLLVYQRRGRFSRARGCRVFDPPLVVLGRVKVLDAELAAPLTVPLLQAGVPGVDMARMVAARWPRLVAHVIAESLGYCTPTSAAMLVLDGRLRRRNWCEWVWSCYGGDAAAVVRQAFQARRAHSGYMADYGAARLLVERFVAGCGEPLLASWF